MLLEPFLNANLSTFIGSFRMDARSALMALGLALTIGVVIGAQPAWAAKRLAIAEALRR